MDMGQRQARLRPEFAAVYPGVPADEWRLVADLIDCVTAAQLRGGRRSGEVLRGRVLDDRHFEFRGNPSEPGSTSVRSSTMRSRATDRASPDDP